MSVMPKAYSLEFKRRVSDLVRADGGPSIVVAAQVGVSHSYLHGAFAKNFTIDTK